MKHIVQLKNSISCDTLTQDIYGFADETAPLVENNGIHKLGGITNIQEKETLFTAAGDYSYADNGQLIAVVDNGDNTSTVKVDGQTKGVISTYGVEKRAEIKGADDVALTADGTYITCNLNTNTMFVAEYDLDNNLLNSREIVFTNSTTLIQFFTSLSFVRTSEMHYSDSMEFALRLGDQVVILRESDPSAPIEKTFQNTTALGTAAVYASVVYGNSLVIAGAGGRVASFDGINWKNYDGTGEGTSVYSDGTAMGGSAITCMITFVRNNVYYLVIAGAGGRVASFDGIDWRNYNGTGLGASIYYDNATVIGSNNIYCCLYIQNYVLFAGAGGRIGSISDSGKHIYTDGIDKNFTCNGTLVDTNDILSLNQSVSPAGFGVILIGATGGKIASIDNNGSVYRGSISYDGKKAYSADTVSITNPAATGGWTSVAVDSSTSASRGKLVAVSSSTLTTGAVMTSESSDIGITWTARTIPSGAAGGWSSVCYGAGLFVAVAKNTSTNNAVMTSPDGVTWTYRTNPAATVGWTSVTYGYPASQTESGLFVAVSASTATTGAVMTSPDGITWTARTIPSGAAGGWSSVCYGAGRYVAVANNSTTATAVMTSPDGITWTYRTSTAATGGWKSIAYGNGLFVAVSSSTATTGAIQTSKDGIVWVAQTSIAATGGWSAITYGSGIFLAVANNSTVNASQYSTDGVNWIAKTNPAITTGWSAVCFSTNHFFVGVANNTVANGAVFKSTTINTSNICSQVAVGSDNVTAIARFESIAMFGSSAGKIASIDVNTANWSNMTTNDPVSSTGWKKVAYGNGVYVMISQAGTDNTKAIQYSTDGFNWTYSTCQAPAITTGPSDIAFGNGLFVVTFYGDTASSFTTAVQTSPDGINWTTRTTPAYDVSSIGWTKVIWGGNQFVAIVSGTTTGTIVMTSTDGVTWTARTVPAISAELVDIAFGNNIYVAVETGPSGNILTSPDGITWTARTTLTTTGDWYSIVFGNGLFVQVASNAASTSTTIKTSPDGINWTYRTSPFSAFINRIGLAYGNGMFVSNANTSDNTSSILASPDGINWKIYECDQPPAGFGWYTVSSANDTFFIGAVSFTSGVSSVVQTSKMSLSWKNYDGTSNGTGPYNNAVAVGAQSISVMQTFIENIAIATSGGRLASYGYSISPTKTVVVSYFDDVVNRLNYLLSVYAVPGYIPYYNPCIAIPGASTYYSYQEIASLFTNITNQINNPSTFYFGNFMGGIYSSTFTSPATDGYIYQQFEEFSINTTLALPEGVNNPATPAVASWRNYDGTGTGPTIYSANALDYQTINTAVVYNNLLTLSGSRGITGTVSADNKYSFFYIDTSGNPVADLLAQQTSNSYLYVHRYENGFYLLCLINNTLNRITILDDASKVVTYNRGRYAWPQYKNNRTRHIITETPWQDANNLYAYSVIGNIAFDISFYNVQVYSPVSGPMSSIVQSQIGWNYVDTLFKLASSATDIYSMYGPQPSSQPTNFFQTAQFNTATFVAGHGKLSNAFGALSTLPFEFRTNWITAGANPGTQSYLSVACLDQYTPDALGTILTGVGEFDETYQPQVVQDDKLLYKYNNIWTAVKIGKNVANRVQSIDGRLYKINTISPLNVWDTVSNRLEVSSMDYNGKMLYNSQNAPTTSTKVASVVETGFSNSVDTGDKLVQIPNVGTDNIAIFGYRIPITSTLLQNYHIDTYLNDLYSFSTYSDGSELVLPNPDFPIYVSDDRLPVPIGVDYNTSTVVNGSITVFLNKNYDGYSIGNDTAGKFIPFYLFGQTYLFDGLNIYAASIAGNTFQSIDLLCEAFGMQFIASTPTQIFFLSKFDNSLYSFTGGRNLNKALALTTLPTVTKGGFSTLDNSLVLDTADSLIWMRDGLVTKQAKKTTQTNLRFYATSKGLLLTNNSASWQYTFFPQVGSKPLPLMFQTAYHGQKANQKSILKEWVITLYNERKDVVHITCTEKSKDQDAQYENVTKFTLTTKDWDSAGYAFIRVQPKYQRALGSSLQVDLLEKAYILEVSTEYEDSSKAVMAGDKSK